MEQIQETVNQGWSQMHSLLFWIVSVMMNHWKLKTDKHHTMVMNGTFLFGNDGQSPTETPTEITLHNHQQNTNKIHLKSITPIKQPFAIPNLQPKPKSFTKKKNALASVDTVMSNASFMKERKIVVKKQSFTLMKNQMLSWKQKLSNKPIMDEAFVMLNTKQSFLRRLSNSSHSSDTSSSKSEPTSPTGSILKTVTFKLKQEGNEDISIENNNHSRRRLSLNGFKRKNASDITLK